MFVNSYIISITEFGYFFFLTVGICIVSLVTYQGATIKDLGVFDWSR